VWRRDQLSDSEAAERRALAVEVESMGTVSVSLMAKLTESRSGQAALKP